MPIYKTVTRAVAEKRGYSAITSGYDGNERDMLNRVIRDMQGCDFLLVDGEDGISVFRKKTELDKVKAEA